MLEAVYQETQASRRHAKKIIAAVELPDGSPVKVGDKNHVKIIRKKAAQAERFVCSESYKKYLLYLFYQ